MKRDPPVNVRRHMALLTLVLLTACSGGGGGGGGAPGAGAPGGGSGVGPGGSLGGKLVDAPIVGALITCVQLAADGSVVPPVVGQAVSGSNGAYRITTSRDVSGPILCSSSGGNSGALPAPALTAILPIDLSAGASITADINPFTSIVYPRLQISGDFSLAGVSAENAALASALSLSGPLWAASYGGSTPDDIRMSTLINGFDQGITHLTVGGGDNVAAVADLIAALSQDTADGNLNGKNLAQVVNVSGTPLDQVLPAVMPSGSPPVAVAGADQRVDTGTLVSLDAGASSDVDGDPLQFVWRLFSQPTGSALTLTGAAHQQIQFTPLVAGAYTLLLNVSDGRHEVTDSVRVTVNQAVNHAPLADAGSPQSPVSGSQLFLDGSGSSDPDGDAIRYVWTITGQPPGSSLILSSATAPAPFITPVVLGNYTFSLEVNDGQLGSVASTVIHTVVAVANGVPQADAGAAQTVAPNSLVTLDGSASSDPDGNPLSYAWQLDTQPVGSSIVLAGNATGTPSFTPTVAGIYGVLLVVNDGIVNSAPATVSITVTAAINQPPVANPGGNQAVTRFTLVTLNGSGSSDAEGNALSYLWQLDSSPVSSTATLQNPTSVGPTLTPDLAGDYMISLTVNDGALDSLPVTLTLTALGSSAGNGSYQFDGQAQNDWLGYAVAGPGDLDGDGIPELAVGAQNAGAGAGLVQIYNGASSALMRGFSGQAAGDFFGRAMSRAGDVDGDGVGDLIVGAHGNDQAANNAGLVQVIGGASGAVLYSFTGDVAGDGLGRSVADAGDLNGDGRADVVAGAPDANNGAGFVRAYSGLDGSPLFTVSGSATEGLGTAVAGPGDVNGDGFDDILVGSPGAFTVGPLSGQVEVLSGLDGSVIHNIHGSTSFASFGRAVAGLGDINADGFADFAVAAPSYSALFANGGQVRVYSGKDATVLYTFDGQAASDQLGIAVAGVGDVNGDGVTDLAVGAPGNDTGGSSAGQVQVYSGATGGVLFTINGVAAFDGLGRAVAGVGDVDGDGYGDLLTGAPGHDSGAPDAGRAELILGGP